MAKMSKNDKIGITAILLLTVFGTASVFGTLGAGATCDEINKDNNSIINESVLEFNETIRDILNQKFGEYKFSVEDVDLFDNDEQDVIRVRLSNKKIVDFKTNVDVKELNEISSNLDTLRLFTSPEKYCSENTLNIGKTRKIANKAKEDSVEYLSRLNKIVGETTEIEMF